MKSKILIGLIIFCSNNLFSQTVSLSTSAVTLGGTTTVTWSGFSGNVNIKVYKGTTYWKDANANVSGSGS
ncbi:MAG: hypothetical protein ACOYM7_05750 [Paludibacter sp.]